MVSEKKRIYVLTLIDVLFQMGIALNLHANHFAALPFFFRFLLSFGCFISTMFVGMLCEFTRYCAFVPTEYLGYFCHGTAVVPHVLNPIPITLI